MLRMLSFIESGSLIISSTGTPLLSIDPASRELGVELTGVSKLDSGLPKLLGGKYGLSFGEMRAVEQLAKQLHSMKWKLSIYHKGSRVATIGYGVSRLTGHISVNPLNLKKIMDALS